MIMNTMNKIKGVQKNIYQFILFYFERECLEK